jgi:hypothetical protein
VGALDLSSPRYLIEHAKRRVAEFKAELLAYGNSNPYASVLEHNRDGTEDIYKIKLVKPIPFGLNGIAFDAANGLRSALDQGGYATAIASGKSESAGRRIRAAFPFCDNPTEVKGRRNGEGRDIPQEIFDLMFSFKPYLGGNELLWSLNKLANSNKHRILAPFAMINAAMKIPHLETGHIIEARWPPQWDSAKNEMMWLRQKRGSKLKGEVQFVGFVSFNKIEPISRQPADAIFDRLVTEVTTILDAIEAKAARIGL